MKNATARRSLQTPPQIAAAAVRDLFDHLTSSTIPLIRGTDGPDFSETFDRIERALAEADDPAPPDADEDTRAFLQQQHARDAGYLVGIEVGRRIGGAR